MSSLLPSLPTAPVIRPSTELQSDPCCDKAEQVKHEIKPFVDLNHAERSFMQLRGFGRAWRPSPREAGPRRRAAIAAVFRLRRCLLSSSRAVFLALAQVNHSTLTIFALPLYKRRGTRPTDPITSLSGNKCLTIQPYWVWEINPFHSGARPVSSENSQADVTVIIIVRHHILQPRVSGYLLYISKAVFPLLSSFHLLSPVHFVVSFFIFSLVGCSAANNLCGSSAP